MFFVIALNQKVLHIGGMKDFKTGKPSLSDKHCNDEPNSTVNDKNVQV